MIYLNDIHTNKHFVDSVICDLSAIQKAFEITLQERKFIKKCELPIFIYYFTHHMAPNKVKFSSFENLHYNAEKITLEEHTCSECIFFTPFLEDNDNSAAKFVKANLDPQELWSADELKQQGPGYDWNENSWTKRLTFSLKRVLPNYDIAYTAEKGMDFHCHIVSDVLNLPYKFGLFLFFQGAPDIVISKNLAVTLNANSAESSDEDIIENCFQHTDLKSSEDGIYPEKLGQLFGYLHMLLAAKIMRRLVIKEKSLDKSLKVKGILLDKMCGGIECAVTFTSLNEPLKWDICDYTTATLTASSICMHIKNIVCD